MYTPGGSDKKIDVNTFSFITRVYAEDGVTLTDLFDELADSLDGQLEHLSEDGFVNTYVSLTLSKLQGSQARGNFEQKLLDSDVSNSSHHQSRHRTALSDLDEMLIGNLDRLSLDALADL